MEGINSGARTIDIDTSAQIHQIGGRFSEALSTSLSIHGAHEEALKRIEHYSMTSMYSSAHSIRSMDSIRTELRTELSRLETMITSVSNAHPSEVETEGFHQEPSSSHTEGRFSAVAKAENQGSHMSAPVPLPEHDDKRSSTKDSGIKAASQRESLNETRDGLNGRTQAQRTRETAVEKSIETDSHIPSVDEPSAKDEPEDEKHTGEVNKVSDLYAEFSKDLEPRRNESAEVGIDPAAIHHILRQSLASIYPPEVVKYISLQQVITLCENHIDLLDRRPSVQRSAVGKMKERSYVYRSHPAAARPSMVELRDRLVELRTAIKVSREQCIEAGYSLSEMDKPFSPSGTGSYAPADRPPAETGTNSGDESSSIRSEDFHSSAE